jgi:1,2-diacylglycerol 3-alpha-glucosyltransferase
MAIKRLIHRNIDGVFIPAPSHLAYYEKMGFPSGRVMYGVDAVDNEYFRRHADTARAGAEVIRAKRGLPEKYFLFVGRFLPCKGLETLISAYGHYRTQAGSTAWNLVLVGNGPYLEQVQTMTGYGLGIHFAGVITGTELCHYYGLAQTLVLPSVHETWGLVVNEGMAAGLPVLVSRGCGAAETLVREGTNGWTFAPGNIDELAGLLTRMNELKSEDLRQMGRNSQTIIAEWSLDRFAEGVVEALNLPRREPGGVLADMVTKIWKGRVSIN